LIATWRFKLVSVPKRRSNSLTSASGRRTYDHAIREFVAWYCSEPRLASNRTVVLRYRIHLEQKQYAPATINLRLAAVRRVAYEAADGGLLSPKLAAGIRRVKGVRRLGVRLGNWLTPEQGRRLLEHSTPSTPRALRDHAMVAILIGCGLRRAELLALTLESIQQREEHWVIADLVGKGGHMRTARTGSRRDGVDTDGNKDLCNVGVSAMRRSDDRRVDPVGAPARDGHLAFRYLMSLHHRQSRRLRQRDGPRLGSSVRRARDRAPRTGIRRCRHCPRRGSRRRERTKGAPR
jgi:integrase